MSAGEVAALFGVDTSTVANWAETGKLRSFRTPGGHRRFHRADVEALLPTEDTTEAAS